MATVWTVAGERLHAIPPDQFRVWGTSAPPSPPLPEGWTELRTPRLSPELTPNAEEQERGFVISAPDPFLGALPRVLPFPSERAGQLNLAAAQGQYEAASLVVHALRPLDGLRIVVRDLHSPGGQTIAADHVDVRFVRAVRVPVDAKAKTYRRTPFFLEKAKAVAVATDEAIAAWLTVKVPESAAAGDYTGTVLVRAAGQDAAEIALAVKVFPFRLPPAPVEIALFHPNFPASDDMLMKQLVDMREHGCNGVEPAMQVVIKSRDRDFGADDVAATRTECKRLMDAEQKVFGPRRFPATVEFGHQIAYYWDPAKGWFAFWPHSKKIDGDFLRAADVVLQMGREEKWPPLRAYVLDEAGAHNLLDEAVYYYGMLKRERPELLTWTDIGGGMAMGIDEIGPLSSCVDIMNTNRFTPEIAKALAARGKPYAVYNGCGPTPAGARFFFGSYGYKTGGSQILQWAYHAGNGPFQGRGFRADDEGYVYPVADGPLPSVMWEAVREGIDDYRYLHLLAQEIAQAKHSAAPGAKEAAAEAEQGLRDLLGRIAWGFQPLETADRTPPPHPATLRKWREQVVGQILKLQPLAIAGREAVAVRPVSPLEIPWAEPVRETVRYGKELLPSSGFRGTTIPWQVQAWNGKGRGQLDASQTHDGRRSVRIDVPASAGSQAVTVLVWSMTPERDPKVTLEGGRRYEFSAWAKWQGRGTPPSLRMALPAWVEKASENGRDPPTADGWCRLWMRSELQGCSVPKYLAAWVQGPGTAWIADLSLREVLSTPLELSIDQETYDGQDRVGFLFVKLKESAAAAQMLVSLSSGGPAAALLRTRIDGQTGMVGPASFRSGSLEIVTPASISDLQLAFDPSHLAPGRYRAEVQLLDVQGALIATKARTFQRVSE